MFRRVLTKKMVRVTKTALYVSRGYFRRQIVEENKFILGHFPIFSKKISHFSQKYWKSCQTFLLRVHQKILREQNLEEKGNWNRFRTLETKFWNFAQMCSTDPSELSSTYPEDNFQGKFYLKNYVFRFSRTSNKKNWTFCGKFHSADLSIMLSTRPKEGFGRIFCLEIGLHELHSRTSSKNDRVYCGTLQGGLSKLKTYVSKSFVGKIWFPKYRSISFFVDCEQKLSGLSAKTFCLEWITAFDV